jgi:transposase
MDGRDELCGQDALNRRERLHLEVSYKRLEKGRFVWPQAKEGAVSLTPAQLSMLLEGIDWRMPIRTWRPEMAG